RNALRHQLDLEGAYVFQSEAIWRVAEITAELRNGVDVGSLGRRRQIADRHVLGHATTQRARLGHLKLLSEGGGLQHPRSSATGDPPPTDPPLPRKRVRSIPLDSVKPDHACLTTFRADEARRNAGRGG